MRDDKKRNYYLITVKGDKRVDLKKFQKKHGTRRLSFASADDLMAIMGLIPGAVTPLGVLNDEERRVEVCLDRDFLAEPGKIGVHPNDNRDGVAENGRSDRLDLGARKHGAFHADRMIQEKIWTF